MEYNVTAHTRRTDPEMYDENKASGEKSGPERSLCKAQFRLSILTYIVSERSRRSTVLGLKLSNLTWSVFLPTLTLLWSPGVKTRQPHKIRPTKDQSCD